MIGDVLISSLICENLKRTFPNATIDYLVNSNTLPVLENNPFIDNLIIFNESEHRGLLKLIRYSRQLKQNQYDVIIDAYSKIQSWVNVSLQKSPVKISYKKIGREILYTHNIVKHQQPKTHLGLSIEHRLSLLQPLGITDPVATEPKLYLTDKEKQIAKDVFKLHKVNPDRKTVMISLLGSDMTKTYPLNQMAKLVNEIGEVFDVNILFNYFPNQKNQALEVYNQLTDNTKSKVYFDLLGDDLRSFIAIANECDLIVGNDGGAINMSKALGKKSFIIFSPWIDKSVWATFEDGKNHVSVHLKDYFPEKFIQTDNKEIKKVVDSFYSLFDFELFKDKLKSFLNHHI